MKQTVVRHMNGRNKTLNYDSMTLRCDWLALIIKPSNKAILVLGRHPHPTSELAAHDQWK